MSGRARAAGRWNRSIKDCHHTSFHAHCRHVVAVCRLPPTHFLAKPLPNPLPRPLKKPVIALWHHDWLAVDNGNGPTAADGDFVLVIARCAPSFIVMMNDAQARMQGGGANTMRVCE